MLTYLKRHYMKHYLSYTNLILTHFLLLNLLLFQGYQVASALLQVVSTEALFEKISNI